MEMQQHEKELTVVQTWAIPIIVVFERVTAPFRWLGRHITVLAVAFGRGTARVATRGARRTVDLAKAARERLTHRVAFMPHSAYAHLRMVAADLETQALIIAGHLEDTEKRLKACLGIARTLHGLGRQTSAALSQAFTALSDQDYWKDKPERIEAATHYAAMMTELAANSGERTIAFDAYTLAQQYGAMLGNYYLKIRFFILMSDVAEHVVHCDRSSWLGRALEEAIVIRERAQRMRIVSAVATKMVSVGIAPPTGFSWDAVLKPSENFDDYGITVKAPPPDTEVSEAELAAFDEHVA